MESWYANQNIRSGEDWDYAINLAIQDCDALVLMFCSEADSSRQVKRELALADKYRKPVYWLRVERVEPNKLSYFLTSTQWLDWLDMRDTTLEKLIEDISNMNEERQNSHYPISNDTQGTISPTQLPREVWAKGVIALDTDSDVAKCVAQVYFHMARSYPDSSIILPTGRSGTKLFRAMNRLADDYVGSPFGDAIIISDTETFGVWDGHDTSRTRHIKEMLIEPLSKKGKSPDVSQLHLLSGIYTSKDPVKEAQKTLRMYPPSMHAISVSPLGEIIAYEVGTYNDINEIIDDGPRILEVGMHSKKYIDPNQPSKSILSVGLGTSLSASILLVLALDVQKATIVHRLFNGPITAGIPATLLRYHPNAYLMTTKAVAKEAGITDLITELNGSKEAAEWIVQNQIPTRQ